MKKQRGYWKGFGSGLVLAILVLAMGVTAAAASRRTIEVEDGVSLTLNGTALVPRDADGRRAPVFFYNGAVYAPLRAVCEAAGMEVDYVSSTNTVKLTSAERTAADLADVLGCISVERAKEIALADAGVKASKAVFVKARLDWDDGRAKYEVEFYSGSVEYDYDIDAITGSVLSMDRDLDDGVPQPDGGASLISADRAKQIALGRAPKGAAVVSCKLDREDGRYVYEIELRSGSMEYDCDVDAQTGAIVDWDSDYDD